MLVSLNLAADFNECPIRAVHHDVGDVVAHKQRLERAISQHVIADVVEQFFLLGNRHDNAFQRNDFVDDVADFFASAFSVETRQLGQIDRLNQGAEDHAFGLVILLGPRPRGYDFNRAGRRPDCDDDAGAADGVAGAAVSAEPSRPPKPEGVPAVAALRPNIVQFSVRW